MAERPRMVRAVLYEFGAISPSGASPSPEGQDTLWLGLKAQVLDEHGETHDYICDPIAFHPLPKNKEG